MRMLSRYVRQLWHWGNHLTKSTPTWQITRTSWPNPKARHSTHSAGCHITPRRKGVDGKWRSWLISIASLLAISSTFDSLFKVLFIFPSRYLFTIGLSYIFSFRWNLPPTLGCNPKQPDSLKARRTHGTLGQRRGSHPLCRPFPRNLDPGHALTVLLQTTTRDQKIPIFSVSWSRFTRRY